MSAARTVHVVVPDGVDDPTRPSGGNTYDRRVCETLAADGWCVRPLPVAGDWPWADATARRALGEALDALPHRALVVVDGLLASATPAVVVPAAARLRLVVLVHLPLGHGRPAAEVDEAAVLRAAGAVVTTSEWSRRWLLAAYDLDPACVRVAAPGVDPAQLATGSGDAGSHLLCVGAVTPGKGHDLLLAALREVADLGWTCTCVGSLTVAREYVADLRRRLAEAGLDDRVVLAGPRTGAALTGSYAAADLLVLASRVETYGMVVTEALAHGLPVIAPDVGGVPEALGKTADGRRPGLLTPPGDPHALARALGCWLSEAALRRDLRAAARQRRGGLAGWSETADRVARVLVEVAA